MTLLNLRMLDKRKLRTGRLTGLPLLLARAIRGASDTPNRRDTILEDQFELMISYVEHEEEVFIVRVSNIDANGNRLIHDTLFQTLCKCVNFELLKQYAVCTGGVDFDVWYNAEDMENLSKRDFTMYLYVPPTAENVKTFVCFGK